MGVYSPVYKAPGETRDAITLTPYALYLVWKMNAIVDNMIKDNPEVGNTDDLRSLNRYFKGLKGWFLHVDMEKAGLTLPHYLIKIVVEEVNKKSL